MSSERGTSDTARPRNAARRIRSSDGLLGDLTSPIRAERRLVQPTGVRWLIGIGAVAVVAGLLVAMFALPLRTGQEQRAAIAAKEHQLAVLGEANAQLAAEVGHLQTIEGARQAARDEMGLVGPGEERRTILANDLATLALPSGFPYDAIAQAVATRAASTTPQP